MIRLGPTIAALMCLSMQSAAFAQSPEFARPAAVSRSAVAAASARAERRPAFRFPQTADSTDHRVLGAFIGVLVGGTTGALIGSSIKEKDDCQPACNMVDPLEGVGVFFRGLFGAIFGGIIGGMTGWWIGKRS
jgi:prolipoprotein diacylglyceryltransferase